MNINSKLIATAITMILSVTQVNAASFEFSPSSGEAINGCVNSVNVIIDTEGQPSNAAEVKIFYDKNNLDVTQIIQGNAFRDYPIIEDDNNGEIYVLGMSLSNSLQGEKNFITIMYQVTSTAPLNPTNPKFSFDFTLGSTTDSNIAHEVNHSDLLTSVNQADFQFTPSAPCTNDTAAPRVNNMDPARGEHNVPGDSLIKFQVYDPRQDSITPIEGIDIDSLSVEINGTTYTSDGNGNTEEITDITIINDTTIEVTITPLNVLPTEGPTTVFVTVRDLAETPNQLTRYSYTFNEPESLAPAAPEPLNCEDLGYVPINTCNNSGGGNNGNNSGPDIVYNAAPEDISPEVISERFPNLNAELCLTDNDRDDIDSDGDGINDLDEVIFYGTDPNEVNSDGEGESDYEEINGTGNPKSNGRFFLDSDEIAWANKYVVELDEIKLLKKNNKGFFEFSRPIARWEFIKLLADVIELPIGEHYANFKFFKDVKASDHWAKYINFGYFHNFFSFNDIFEKKFQPNKPLRRIEAMRVLLSFANMDINPSVYAPGHNKKFNDLEGFDTGYVETAFLNRIITRDDKFIPNEHISRAEAIKMIISLRHYEVRQACNVLLEDYLQ